MSAQVNNILEGLRAAKTIDEVDAVTNKYKGVIAFMREDVDLAVRVIHIENLWKLRRSEIRAGHG